MRGRYKYTDRDQILKDFEVVKWFKKEPNPLRAYLKRKGAKYTCMYDPYDKVYYVVNIMTLPDDEKW